MDTYSAHLLAASRHADLVKEAAQSRLAKAARDNHKDETRAEPRPTRARRATKAGRPVTV